MNTVRSVETGNVLQLKSSLTDPLWRGFRLTRV